MAGTSPPSPPLIRALLTTHLSPLLITGAGIFEHMTPMLRNLHWLPIRHRIKFKTAVLVYKMSSRHGSTIRHTAHRSHHKLDDPTCDAPQQGNSLCHVQGQPTAAVALLYMALQFGTVCQLNCDHIIHMTILWTCSENS